MHKRQNITVYDRRFIMAFGMEFLILRIVLKARPQSFARTLPVSVMHSHPTMYHVTPSSGKQMSSVQVISENTSVNYETADDVGLENRSTLYSTLCKGGSLKSIFSTPS